MNTTVIRVWMVALFCVVASHAYAEGPCDDIANAGQKQRCLNNELQKARQLARQPAQLRAEQMAQSRQAQVKLQQEQQRQLQRPPPPREQPRSSRPSSPTQQQAPVNTQQDRQRQGQITRRQEPQPQPRTAIQRSSPEGASRRQQQVTQSREQQTRPPRAQPTAQANLRQAAQPQTPPATMLAAKANQSTTQKRATASKGSLSGKVHANSGAGSALSGVSVRAGGKSETTGNNGKFKLDGIAAGSTTVAFSKSGYESYQGSVNIAAGKTADMGDRWLTERATPVHAQPPPTAKGSVSGKLHKNAAAGPLLDGVSVRAGGKSETTGRDGKFKIEGLAGGNATVTFSKAGYESYQGSVNIAAGKNADTGDRWLTEKAIKAGPPNVTKASIVGGLCGPNSGGRKAGAMEWLIPEYVCFDRFGGLAPSGICAVAKVIPVTQEVVYFGTACGGHDTCYATRGQKKKICDARLYQEMERTCVETIKKDWAKTLLACKKTALLFYDVVKTTPEACDAYKQAQEQAGVQNPQCKSL